MATILLQRHGDRYRVLLAIRQKKRPFWGNLKLMKSILKTIVMLTGNDFDFIDLYDLLTLDKENAVITFDYDKAKKTIEIFHKEREIIYQLGTCHCEHQDTVTGTERREGRINRFESLAIRQNVAKRYGNIVFAADVWKEMFEEARLAEKTGGSSDLIPFWGLRESDDMVKIERIVLMYPFSRDGLAYERLSKILSLYRLTLGQARQEELLEYLFKNCDDVDQLKALFINLSSFYKERKRI